MSWREHITREEQERVNRGAPLSSPSVARGALEAVIAGLIKTKLEREMLRKLDSGLHSLPLTRHRNPWLDHHIATAEDFVLALLKPADDAFGEPMKHSAVWMDAKVELAKTAIVGYFAHYHDQGA